MLHFFEKLVHPYPEAEPTLPPRRFFAFLWACTEGIRPWLLLMTLASGLIGAFEAGLFAILGGVVDWLSTTAPDRLWADQGHMLLLLAAVMAASVLLVGVQSALKHQSMAGNFPMLLRWNFHRLMLGQSMHFYQDEFAGRIATKVMQTALAVRDTWMILCELMVFVIIYFVTILATLGSFSGWLMLPFAGWVALYAGAVWYFVPRLAKVSQAQADARSLMTGRITDAYTNIATVKLFSHSQREAGYARAAMREFMVTVHGQMRLVTGFEVVNQSLSMLLIGSTAGMTGSTSSSSSTSTPATTGSDAGSDEFTAGFQGVFHDGFSGVCFRRMGWIMRGCPWRHARRSETRWQRAPRDHAVDRPAIG